eukprot:6590334-Prymnesium_polylepis.1
MKRSGIENCMPQAGPRASPHPRCATRGGAPLGTLHSLSYSHPCETAQNLKPPSEAAVAELGGHVPSTYPPRTCHVVAQILVATWTVTWW